MSYPVAGFLRRFFALLVDCLILEVAGGVITFPLIKKYDLRFDEIVEILARGEVAHLQQIAVFLLINLFIVTLLWGFYFTCFIGATGQTPGKKLLGIKVIRLDGNGGEMDYKTAWNRFLGLSISASVLFLGFVWALFDDKNQTWHDKMANTIVVKLTSS